MQRAPDHQAQNQPPDEADLATIGLVVYFLALIVIVGVLLLAPALF